MAGRYIWDFNAPRGSQLKRWDEWEAEQLEREKELLNAVKSPGIKTYSPDDDRDLYDPSITPQYILDDKDALLAALEPQNKTVGQKAIGLLRAVPNALAGANIEAEKASNAGISEWSAEGFKAGLEGFKKGITGQKDYSYEEYLTEAGMDDGTSKQALALALELASNPLSRVGAKVAKPIVNAPVQVAKTIATKTPTVVKKGIGIGAAATGYETIKGATDPDYADRRETFPSQFGASLRGGAGDTVSLVGSSTAWKDQDELADTLKKTGANISKGYESKQVPFTWRSFFDPEWYANNVARSIPTTAVLIPLMYAGYKVGAKGAAWRGFGKFWQAVIGSLAGSAALRPAESALEAGSAYEDAIARGMSEQEADAVAQRVYEANLSLAGLDAAQLAIAFAPAPVKPATMAGKAATLAGKLAIETATEAGEEGYQQAVQQQATGADPRGIIQQILKPSAEMKESMAIGGLFGLGMGGAGAVNDFYRDLPDRIQKRVAENLPPEMKTQVAQNIENYMDQGDDEATATQKAMDELAETPEGQEVIATTTQTVASEVMQEVAAANEVAQQVAAQNTVYDKKGNALQIIDDSNPEFLVVQNANSERSLIPRNEVSFESPEQAQEATQAPVNVVAPTEPKSAPVEQMEGNQDITEELIQQAAQDQVTDGSAMPELQPEKVEAVPTIANPEPILEAQEQQAIKASLVEAIDEHPSAPLNEMEANTEDIEPASEPKTEEPKPEREIYKTGVVKGAIETAPVYETHNRGKNWLAVIDIDPKSPGGIARNFQKKAYGDYKYMVDELQVGDAVEFGADYYSGRGNKNTNRWYGVVTEVGDNLSIERYENAKEAVAASEVVKRAALTETPSHATTPKPEAAPEPTPALEQEQTTSKPEPQDMPKEEIKDEPAAQTPEPSQAEPSSKEVGDFTITKTTHSDTGADIWVVKPKTKLSNQEFTALNAKMRKLGGAYSKFTKGFNFKEDPTSKLQPEAASSPESKPSQSNADYAMPSLLAPPKDAPAQEDPHRAAHKTLKREITKFSKKLAERLGYEPDTDKKGKAVYASVNHMGATIILWKPNTDYGIYIHPSYEEVKNGKEHNYNSSLRLEQRVLYRVTTKKDKYMGLANHYMTPTNGILTVSEVAPLVETLVDRHIAFDERKAADSKTADQPPQAPKQGKPATEPSQITRDTLIDELINDVVNDQAVKNAVANSDKENALLEIGNQITKYTTQIFNKYIDQLRNTLAADVLNNFTSMTHENHVGRKKLIQDIYDKLAAKEPAPQQSPVESEFSPGEVIIAQPEPEPQAQQPEKPAEPIKNKDRSDDSTKKAEDGVELNQKEPAKEGEQGGKPDQKILEPGNEEGVSGGRLPSGTNVDSIRGTGGEGSGVSGENVESVAGEVPVQQSEDGSNSTRPSANKATHGSNEGRKPKGAADGPDDSHIRQQRGDGKDTNRDTDGSSGVSGEPEGSTDKQTQEEEQSKVAYENFRINEDNPVFVKGSKKARYEANIEALKTLDKVLSENREPTIEEQRKLALFSGWGALHEVFTYKYEDESSYYRPGSKKIPKYKDWEKEFYYTKELLDGIEERHFEGMYNYRGGLYENASGSTMNAHYTSPAVISCMFDALQQMGFKRGNLLEPSMGTGNFFGMLPDTLRSKTKLYGVELDPVTGKIAQLLYPNADIRIQGFQKSLYPDNFFDAVVGNVPFGAYQINDKNYPKFVTERIHNYFFARSLDKVKPGGIVAFISSVGTMDAPGNQRVREYLSQKANLVGAIRLPGDAFKDNAGTEVTTDIIFLQKLKEGELPGDINWTKTGEVEVDGSKYPLNQYYIDHPDMVLGDYVVDKLTGKRVGVKSNRDDITEAIREVIEKNLPKDIIDTRRSKPVVEMSQEVAEMADSMLEGGISLIEGKLYRKIGTELVPITKNVAQIKQLVQIRELAKEVLSMQRDPEASEAELEAKRKEMKSLYDSYVNKYSNLLKVEFRKGKPSGRPHVEKILGYSRQIGKDKKGNIKTVFTTEPETYLLKGLEIETRIVDQNGNVKQQFKPSQLLTTRTYRVAIPVDKVNNAQDGLVACLNEFGYLDMDHISKIYGKSEAEIVEELGNKIFHDPLVGWVTADEYLSGNVKKKLREAQERAEYEPEYERNVEALSSIIPKDIPFTDISVSLGDGWVPFEITEKVVKKILGFTGMYADEGAIILEYSPFDNKWNLRKGSRFRYTAEMSSLAAGIPKDPLSIVKIALNNSDTIIKQTDSEGKTQVNQEATNALKSKVKEIRDYLKDYLAEDLDAMNQVEKVYNEKFNNTVPRDYEKIAEVFEFPNMNPEIELRPHQKTAIVRALLGGNSLLAHGVGAGKTYEQIAIAMEAKRLGLANKPLLVVPNTKLTDFENDAKALYPGAKVLALSQDDFDGNSIKRTLALAALNDWDMVIVRHSSFSKIPVSPATQIPALQAEIQELEAGLADMAGERGVTIKKMEKRLEQLRVKLYQYQENRVQYEGLMHFEDMGFDMLIVDEAHEYKNYPLTGRATAIKGLASGDADKARDMMIKSGYIRKLNSGNHGVVFGTGTPISNSMAEVFVMFKYMRPDLLQEAGISNFDAWTDAFADIREVAEISARGEFRNKFQFKSFVNLPELITLFREFTDIKMQDDLDLPLPKHEVIKVECDPHPLLAEVMKRVDDAWDAAIKNRTLFRLINIVLNAPQDMRLVMAGAQNHKGSKVNKVTENAYKIYKETAREKGTQLIFATTGESSLTGFSLWDEIKAQLVKKGIPENEIAFIKTGIKEDQLEEIYRKINAGKIRVAIGSFSKMGVGINVQERLFAIHELNAPYRPSDIEQAEGRMIRQGNSYYGTDKTVQVYRYVTVGEEGAFSGDAFKWQILENKIKSINALMKGDPSVRTIEAFDDDAYDAATMKAIAIGDERYLRKVELEGEIDMLRSAYNAYLTARSIAQRELTMTRDRLNDNNNLIAYMNRYLKSREAIPEENRNKQIVTIDGKEYSLADKEAKEEVEKAIREKIAKFEKKPKKDIRHETIAKVNGLTLVYEQSYTEWHGSTNQRLYLFDGYAKIMQVDAYSANIRKVKKGEETFYSEADVKILDTVFRKISSIPKAIDKMLQENDVLGQDIEKYKEALQQPFKRQEELDSKRAELREIDIALGVDTVDATPETEEAEDADDTASPPEQRRTRHKLSREQLAPIFYSQLRRVIEQKMPNKAVPNQVLAIIKSGQVKADEVKWSGIEDWLKDQTGRVSKEDVLAFLDANDVQIEEIEKGVKSPQPLQLYDDNDNLVAYVERNETGDQWVAATTDGEYFEEYESYNDARHDLMVEQERIGGRIIGDTFSRYSQYQIPGGDNYREFLFTLPQRGGVEYRSPHWGERNVLAHVRFNDRTTPDGEKVLFIEEVQSDWHQEGRKKGYKGEGKYTKDAVAQDLYGQNYADLDEAEQNSVDIELEARAEGNTEGVPDAPFKKTWHEFVLKRMIRYAAENGYDRIAWTTGEQQAERYDLRKQVSEVSYYKNLEGNYDVDVTLNNGNKQSLGQNMTPAELEDQLGKDVAQRLIDKAEKDDAGTLSGVELKVGGEGMKGFYDKMLPAFLNKYGKKWGAKVEIANLESPAVEVSSLPITEAMKESVLYEGQPKYKEAPKEIQSKLDEASQIGGFKLHYAPQALKRGPYQMANELAKILTGNEIIPYTTLERTHGFSLDGQIFLNSRSRQPLLYITSHEIGHTIESTHPRLYKKLRQIIAEHVADPESVSKHYVDKYGYDPEEVPDELTADILAECMGDKSFWQRVREKAPELLKPILDVIDRIIKLGKDQIKAPAKYQMMGYMKDVELLRDRVATVYAEYLKDVQRGKGKRTSQQRAAAKAKTSTVDPTETAEFKKWFGDSKVVDENGNPLVVYHGTDADFSVFSKELKGSNTIDAFNDAAKVGYWFTDDIEAITDNMNIKNLIPSYIKMENPFVLDEGGIQGPLKRLDKMAAKDGADNLVKRLQAEGYDGIIFRDPEDMNGAYQYAVFEPTQIKSVNNRGTWDPTNPDIRFKKDEGDKFALPDEEVQQRIEKSRGVPKETVRERLAELLDEIVRKGHREFEHLPRTGEFAELRNSLLNLRKQKGIAAHKTLSILDGLTKPMNEYEYDVFSYKVIFDDLAHEFEEGRLLPFGLTEDNFEDIKAYIDEEAAKLPQVQEAIAKRKEAWAEIKDAYIEAQQAVGFNVENRLKKEDYYHHQVLEYANKKGLMGTGKKLRVATGRGFLKQRGGSSFDINSDYLQAEFEVMAQMIMDAEIAKTIKIVKDNHDIVQELKREAVRLNDEAMLKEFERLLAIMGDTETSPEKMYRQMLNKKQAIAFGKLYKMAARGELPEGPDGKYRKLIEVMAGVDQAEDIPENYREKLWQYINYLADRENEDVESYIVARTIAKGRIEKMKAIKNTLGDRYVTWEDLIPEGYTLWQPREGHMFYTVNSIPQGMSEQLFYGIMDELKISADMLKKEMAIGQKYPEMVVKEEVAATLEGLYSDSIVESSKLKKIYPTVYRGWKQYQLTMPRRYFKFNIRNMTGDLDAVLTGNPSALRPDNLKKAWTDLWQAFFSKDKTMSPELKTWFERGGFESLLQAQEINDINRNRQFRHLMEQRSKQMFKDKNIADKTWTLMKNSWNTYWDFARTTTDFREALLRYACYLDYAEQIKKGNGKPNNWGASNQDEIMALKDPLDRAAKMANELLGAYDEVSVIGTWLADHLFPFWRWNEVNFVRYSKLFRNAYRDGKLMAAIAGKATGVAIRSPYIAWQIGKFLVKAYAFTAMITAWNWLFFDDEDKELPEDVRSRLHIVLGRDQNGKVIYFSRLGAWQDFVDWFGLDTPVKMIRDFLSGRKSAKEIAIDWLKDDANKVINAITPIVKTPTELLTDRKLYPDAFDPTPIHDRWEYLAESFGLINEYKALTRKPTRGYGSSIPDVFVYRSDPYETAYFANKENVAKYKKKIGKQNQGYSESQRSDALYNIKMAMRYGDEKAFQKYLLEYAALGGTAKGLNQSMKSLDPLYGLSKDDKLGYINSLDAEGRENLARAIDYYQRVIGGNMFED